MGIRLHSEDPFIKEHLTEGAVGLELESHRIDPEGHLAQTDHPFPESSRIDRDFGEAQTEIGTSPDRNVNKAVEELKQLLTRLHTKLKENGELLWPFSNPPILGGEEDIRIARYEGDRQEKTLYREYLSGKYGRYLMTYSGIHFNYSFLPELIHRNFELDGGGDPGRYNDRFYLELAQKVLQYGWAVVALLAASPVLDSSFFEKGRSGRTVFAGKASMRCSEEGYWNFFAPVLDYSSIPAYTASIQKYVDNGMLCQAAELYYPVRIKNPGVYSLAGLAEKGIDHIELRMIDLNPFSDQGIELRDAVFMKLFLIWLASREATDLSAAQQVQALQNYKTAAAYDWDIAKIVTADGRSVSVREALREILTEMQRFFDFGSPLTRNNLSFQLSKVEDDNNRYAVRALREYGEDYIARGLERARQIQEKFCP